MVDLTEIPCQEIVDAIGDKPIECGRTSDGSRLVFHQNDGRHVYVMCDRCADHNIRRRGGFELVAVPMSAVEANENVFEKAWSTLGPMIEAHPDAPDLIPSGNVRNACKGFFGLGECSGRGEPDDLAILACLTVLAESEGE